MSKFSAPEAATTATSSTATAGTNSSGTSGRGPAVATTTTTGGGSSSTGSNKGTGKTEPVYAGGIFSRLEAQFRAEQAARALALQGTQTRFIQNNIICMVDPVFPWGDFYAYIILYCLIDAYIQYITVVRICFYIIF